MPTLLEGVTVPVAGVHFKMPVNAPVPVQEHEQIGAELKAAPKICAEQAPEDMVQVPPYFGVINVGDVPGLTELLGAGGIVCEDDSLHAGSLFDEINETHSPVNVLIGARKFMEGWDSFRVASMGLMNIGRGEGSQIIQLFGRGVRLHGKSYSLKRSSGLDDETPKQLHLLETLNVFGVRANYMQRFREELQKEGIDPDVERVDVPIRLEEFLDRGLQVLRLPEGLNFVRSEAVIAQNQNSTNMTLDLRPGNSGTDGNFPNF